MSDNNDLKALAGNTDNWNGNKDILNWAVAEITRLKEQNEKLAVYRRRYHQLVDGEGCHFAETDGNWYDVELMNKTLDNEALSEEK